MAEKDEQQQDQVEQPQAEQPVNRTEPDPNTEIPTDPEQGGGLPSLLGNDVRVEEVADESDGDRRDVGSATPEEAAAANETVGDEPAEKE
jgi:hypothetical protein